jgi:hypothetical protein
MILSVDTSEVDRLAVEMVGVAEAIEAVAYATLDKVAAEVQAAAVADAPALTGELKGSIYNRKISADVREIGSAVRQAWFQEFGTSRHGPQPFLFENAERGGDRIAEAILLAAEAL